MSIAPRPPKTARGKRVLAAKEPKLVENTKKTIFTYGLRSTEMLKALFGDWFGMTKPNSVNLTRKKEILPFEDSEPLEYLAKKHDASLFVFGSHNKKRPHNVVIGRTYAGQMRDMVELGLESLRPMMLFPAEKNVLGSKPCLMFEGDVWEADPVYAQIKSLLVDIFRGPVVDKINMEGIDHVISVAATDKLILFRHYRINMKKSGSRLPLVELEEIGPRANFTVRRRMEAAPDLIKLSMKTPKGLKAKKRKNLETNALGDTLGRVHMQKQDLSKLQTRKIKALKPLKRKAGSDDSAVDEKRAKDDTASADDEE
eukprot:m.60648 g.60648  ORF g.60648 m.60648 type:complete len:313 (+) comp17472_c0_seq1:83-1021(+)